MSSEIAFKIDYTPITLDNFFVGHHYANYEDLYNDDKETVVKDELAYPTLEKIQTAEAKLNIKLPKILTQLYLKQNGGSVGGLIYPKVENPRELEADWIFPFSGYDDLYGLDDIRTVFDSVEDYARYPEDIEMYPKDSKRIFVIAQWYRETLFLDYRNSREAKMGFVDFDEFGDLQNDNWEAETFWWDNFDDFFSNLIRGEYV